MLLEIIQPKQIQQPDLISTPIPQNQGWEFLNKYSFAKNSHNSLEKNEAVMASKNALYMTPYYDTQEKAGSYIL